MQTATHAPARAAPRPSAPVRSVRELMATKAVSLAARSRRLVALTPRRVGLRPQDIPLAPSPAHFDAANRRLQSIDRDIQNRMRALKEGWDGQDTERTLVSMAMAEREIDRSRRAFGHFFEIFSQRGSDFAPALAAHDVIAADCYRAVRDTDESVLEKPLLKPVSYMEHGFSPSTMRRGVTLAKLLGESNPFPVIRIPWDRDNPWQPVFLHEVAHNLHADLKLWSETRDAVARRLLRVGADARSAVIFRRWHKEIFADLAALLLGGPSAAWGLLEFLAHPAPRALTYQPGGAHPTGYVRGLILAEMLRRMGFPQERERVLEAWTGLYDPRQGHRLPAGLLKGLPRSVPAVVDEMAYQPRRNVGQRALADLIGFTHDDEAAIRRGALRLRAGQVPDLAPRHLVSASRLALQAGADPHTLSDLVINHLARKAAEERARPLLDAPAAAA